MKRALTSLALCLGLAGAARAQVENHAEASLYARADGDEVRVAVAIDIERGWHLFHGPTLEEMGTPGAAGKPTNVELRGEGFEWGPLLFGSKPVPVEQDFGSGEVYTIYEHKGTLVLYARGRKTSPDADLESITAFATGQNCSEGAAARCADYEEELEYDGPGPDALFARFPEDGAPSDDGGGGEGAPSEGGVPHDAGPVEGAPAGPPAQDADGGLLGFLLSAVFWGLFTLLMPCTYPMIPITISYFTKQASQRHTSILPLSLTYGLGIVAIFVLIGLTIGSLIIPFAAHPVTNLLIGLVFVVFALSLFGMFLLQPPAFLMNAAGRASMRGGYLGVFLMGATLVVTSFTCTAPFVGALLGTGAASGDHLRVALGMAVFGATIAIPFALLSLLPQRVKSLPRSGEWMHTLKVTLGFVELAAALKFISNADLVWNWQLLSKELFLFLWLAIFLTTALYLFGVIKLHEEHVEKVSPGRMVAGLAFMSLSAYCLYGALGNKLDPIMTAIAPNYSGYEGGSSIGGRAAPQGPRHTIVKDDFEAAVALARREGKRVLINFTGFT